MTRERPASCLGARLQQRGHADCGHAVLGRHHGRAQRRRGRHVLCRQRHRQRHRRAERLGRGGAYAAWRARRGCGRRARQHGLAVRRVRDDRIRYEVQPRAWGARSASSAC